MDNKRLTITPFQLQVLRLKKKGFSSYRIGKELRVKDDNIIRNSLKAFQNVFPELEKAVIEVIEEGYLDFLEQKFNWKAVAAKGYKDYREAGCWVGRPPFGYRKGKDGHLKVHPGEAQIVKRLFEGNVLEKKTIRELSVETRILPYKILKILRRTCYFGVTNVKGVLQNTHEAIVDRELWEKAQPSGERSFGEAPFGYRNLAGRVEVFEPEAELVRRIFDLRLNTDKSMPEIGRELGLPYTLIDHVLKRWTYTGQDKKGGLLVKSSYPKIVDLDVFVAVQHKRRRKWEKAVKRNVKRGIENREKIISCFPANSREIEERTGLKRGTINNRLRQLLRDRWIVKREDGRFVERPRPIVNNDC